jgi:hypothetical protein
MLRNMPEWQPDCAENRGRISRVLVRLNLEKADVHEIHEKTRKDSEAFDDLRHHQTSERQSQRNQLICFVFFVDENRF